jgi:hypothetical protein
MEVVADRLSLRWYLGYDLDERLPDHSSLTKIRERYGPRVFRRFFERIVEMCVEAGLVRGEELFIDSTKVEADAAVDSLAPRWFVEAHLQDLFGEDGGEDEKRSVEAPSDTQRPGHEEPVHLLPTAGDEELLRSNRASEDWISRDGAQDRSFQGTSWRARTADTRASRIDPDATPMRWSENARKLGYQTNYVVDGGKARVILSVLVTPGEVGENRPMLDLLFRSAFRWKLRPHHVTADGKYGTAENIRAVEHSGIRAYLVLHEAGGRVGFFRKSEFAYDAEKDLYVCPAGQTLRALGDAEDIRSRGKIVTYRARASACAGCSLMPRCNDQQERSLPEALSQRRVHRHRQGLRGDRALPQGAKETQGVDRAFVRRRQALARHAPVPHEDAAQGQRRSPDDGHRTEHKAATRLRREGAEEVGTSGGTATGGPPTA